MDLVCLSLACLSRYSIFSEVPSIHVCVKRREEIYELLMLSSCFVLRKCKMSDIWIKRECAVWMFGL